MFGVRNVQNLPDISCWKNDIFADYGGSDRKRGLISPDGSRYLIKFAEAHTRKNDLDTSYVNNVLAEYLSSHILQICGYDVHDTLLACYNGELVVGCRNFTSEDEKLIEFGRFLRRYYDSGELGRVPDIEQIRYVFQKDEMLFPFAETLWRSYWCRFTGDALVGNFDRYMGNFGYLVSQSGLKPSPIYDNGSTLFPALSEQGMESILPDEKEILRRTFLFPKAALTVNGQKVRYYDMLASDYVPELSAAVCTMVPEIKKRIPEIDAFIDAQDFLSDIRKIFYKTMLNARFNYILKPAYNRCKSGKFDMDARERLVSGVPYTERDFDKKIQEARLC